MINKIQRVKISMRIKRGLTLIGTLDFFLVWMWALNWMPGDYWKIPELALAHTIAFILGFLFAW